ncbi:MAG TPA: phage tail tape measure protein [Ruminococcaceae bacterium]|nr:phage tail tape measure protein [Oscillospiraceae bacterium]HCM23377.1 phage tail tape measure protein [Oscillospiraceae bacterium]
MAYDGSIIIDTKINGKGIQEGLDSISNSADSKIEGTGQKVSATSSDMKNNINSVGGTASQNLESTGKKLTSTGTKMTLGITMPLGVVGKKVVETGADFEDTMSQTAGALDIPMSSMGSLRSLALKMGADTMFSAKEAGEAMVELAKGGMSEAQIKGGALKSTMDLAAASGMNLGDSANVVVQSMGAFGLSADKSALAANALAGAAAASSTDVRPLTEGLSQCGAQAHLAGWNIQDTTAVLGMFADAGVNGADAGTSLKVMLQRLASPTGKAAKLMKAYGINVRNSDGTMKSASEIAQILHDKLGKLSPATRDAALQTIFGTDASRAAAIMMNNGAKGLAKYTKATYDQSSASRQAKARMGDTRYALEQMNGSIETAAIALATILNPVVAKVAKKIQDLANKFTALPKPAQKAILIIAGMAAAAGPALGAIGKMATGISAISKLFSHFGTGAAAVSGVCKKLGTVFKTVGSGIGSAAKVLGSGLKVVGSGLLKGIKGIGTAVKGLFTLLAANPAALIVIAIAAIVIALIAAYTHCKAFRDGVNAVFGTIGNFFKTIGTGIANFFSKTLPAALAGVGKFFSSIGSSIGNFVTKTVPSAFRALPGIVGGVWNKVHSGASSAWSNICNGITGFAKNIKSNVVGAFNALKGNVSGIWNNVHSAASSAWNAIHSTISNKANDIKNKAISTFNNLKSGASNIWNQMHSGASSAWGTIHSTISSKANSVRNSAISAFNQLKSGASGIWNSVHSRASSAWSGISGTVGNFANSARNKAVGAFNSLRSGVSGVMGRISPIIRNGFNGAIGFLSSLPGKMFHWGSEAIGHLVSGIRSMIGHVGKAVGDVANKIKSFLHFSVPDEGPLRDIMDWPRDMMQQYGGGITSNMRYVTDAVSDVAGNMVLRPNAGFIHRMVSDMYAAVGAESANVATQFSEYSSFAAVQSAPHVSTTVQPAPVTVQTDDRPIVMDGKTVGRVLAPHINEEFGKNDIKVKRGG